MVKTQSSVSISWHHFIEDWDLSKKQAYHLNQDSHVYNYSQT